MILSSIRVAGLEGCAAQQAALPGRPGGDATGVLERPDGSVGVFVLDAEGHDEEAIHEANRFLTALARHPQWGQGHPSDELKAADRILADAGKNRGVAMSFTEVEPRTGRVRFAGGGGMPPALLRSADGKWQRLISKGFYLGNGDYSNYPHNEVEAHLEPGGLLLVRSDGIHHELDANIDGGPRFGDTGIQRVVDEQAWLTADELAARVMQDSLAHPREDDDRSVVIVRRSPEADPLPA